MVLKDAIEGRHQGRESGRKLGFKTGPARDFPGRTGKSENIKTFDDIMQSKQREAGQMKG